MTRWPYRFVQTGLSTLILLVAVCCPSSGWPQEKQPIPASDATGTAPEPAAPAQQPAQPQAGVAVASPAPASEQAGTYTIKQGDTLWDISSAHYRDPFLWPLIWKANPYITDPDLIYPGRALVIPSLAPVERAMAEPEEKAAPAPQAETSQPSFFRKSTVEAPEEAKPAPAGKLVLPKEAEQPLADKYAMLSGGFVSDEPSNDKLIESVSDPSKVLLGYSDEIYINVRSRQDVKAGDLFLIYRPQRRVTHPITGRSYGPLNIVVGVLKVTTVRENGIHTARIIASFDNAERGDLLTPYQEPVLLYPSKEKKTKDLNGYILEVRDTRKINAQIDIVYLDKGKADGVDPGDVFTVLSDRGGSTGILSVIGEVQVFIVKEHTATAVARKSTDTFGKGDRFQFKN